MVEPRHPISPKAFGSWIPETLGHIWGSHEPRSPACKPMSHLCLPGKTNQPRNVQTPMGVPSCRLLARAAPPPPPTPSLPDSRADCQQVYDSHPERSRQPPPGRAASGVPLSLPSPWRACFALGCTFIFRSWPPPSPSPASILRKQTGMCSGFAGKSDRSVPTCSSRLRYGVN